MLGTVARCDMPGQSFNRRLHFATGLATIIAFLVSGAYMRLVAHPDSLEPGPHMMYVSRHIYMLGPGFVNLVLGVYAIPAVHRRIALIQGLGTVLLVLSSILIVLAFVVEPVSGRERTPVSALGLYALWAGALLHVISPALERWTGRRKP